MMLVNRDVKYETTNVNKPDVKILIMKCFVFDIYFVTI